MVSAIVALGASTKCMRSTGMAAVSTPPLRAMIACCCASVRPDTRRTIREDSGPTGVGVAVGASVGIAVGASVGVAVGASVGIAVGASVGVAVGASVGIAVGASVGVAVGAS